MDMYRVHFKLLGVLILAFSVSRVTKSINIKSFGSWLFIFGQEFSYSYYFSR